MDIRTLVGQMTRAGDFQIIARNPLAQFGIPNRRYIGAEIIPERTVEVNNYIEEFVRYRSVIANAGTRYSPVQKKGGALSGSMQVNLADSDKGAELTARDYDALIRVLQSNINNAALGASNPTMAAMAQITNFVDLTVNIPLVERLEAWRWQAIVSASVTLSGDNNYTETVAYSNPSGNRFAASAAWSTVTTDPFLDIFAAVTAAAAKGFTIKRIITSTNVVAILGNNPKVQARVGRAVLNIGGSNVAVASGRASQAEINAQLQQDGIPPLERYDLQYRTETGTARFMPSNVMVFICDTQRDPTLDLGDTYANTPEILDTLNGVVGYMAIGRAAGQSAPGRVIQSEAFSDKPPRIWAEGWQTALPVITDPDAIFVITGIA